MTNNKRIFYLNSNYGFLYDAYKIIYIIYDMYVSKFYKNDNFKFQTCKEQQKLVKKILFIYFYVLERIQQNTRQRIITHY